jgi:hypothetical protein
MRPSHPTDPRHIASGAAQPGPAVGCPPPAPVLGGVLAQDQPPANGLFFSRVVLRSGPLAMGQPAPSGGRLTLWLRTVISTATKSPCGEEYVRPPRSDQNARWLAAIGPTVAPPERSTTEIRRAGGQACAASFAAQQSRHAPHLADGRAFRQASQPAWVADGLPRVEEGAAWGSGAAGTPDACWAQGSARRGARRPSHGTVGRIGRRCGHRRHPRGAVPLAEAVVDRPDRATSARGRRCGTRG